MNMIPSWIILILPSREQPGDKNMPVTLSELWGGKQVTLTAEESTSKIIIISHLYLMYNV